MDKDHLAAAPAPDEDVLPVAWLNPLWPKYCGPHSPVNTYEVTGWRPLIPADQLHAAIAAERARTADTHAAYCHSQQQFHDAVAELSTLRQQLERTRHAPLSDERIVKVFLRAASDRAGFVTLEVGKPSAYMVDIVRMVERELFEGE